MTSERQFVQNKLAGILEMQFSKKFVAEAAGVLPAAILPDVARSQAGCAEPSACGGVRFVTQGAVMCVSRR